MLAHDHEHLRRRRDVARGRAGAPRLGGVRRGRDRRRPQAPGLRGAGGRRAARHGLVERALVSSQYMRSLVAIRAIEPRLRLGWSVPRVRRDYTKSRLYVLPALSALAFMRRRLPGLAAGHVGDGPGRRRDGAPPARHAGAGARRSTARAASSTCGRSTTPRRSAGSRRWASTRSSPTTRGSSRSLDPAGRGAEAGGVGADRGVVADLGHAPRAPHDPSVAASSGSSPPRAGSASLAATSKLQPDSRARRSLAPARVGVLHPAPAAVGASRYWTRKRTPGRGRARAATRGCRSRPGAPRCRRRSRSPTACRSAACAGDGAEGRQQQGDEEQPLHS